MRKPAAHSPGAAQLKIAAVNSNAMFFDFVVIFRLRNGFTNGGPKRLRPTSNGFRPAVCSLIPQLVLDRRQRRVLSHPSSSGQRQGSSEAGHESGYRVQRPAAQTGNKWSLSMHHWKGARMFSEPPPLRGKIYERQAWL